MSTATDTHEQTMTAEEWFASGQDAEIRRIGRITDPEKRTEAVRQFNERNSAFLDDRNARGREYQPHPAIDIAIDEAIQREKGWMTEIRGLSDDQLRDRYLEHHMRRDIAANWVDRGITLAEYKADKTKLVGIGAKLNRTELERKEVLSRMIVDRRFHLAGAKVEYERKKDPKLVELAERNIADRGLRGSAFNDALFNQVRSLQRTVQNAKAIGFKF